MPEKSLTVEQVLAMLAAAPPHLAGLTADLAPAQLHTPPAADEWSANEVLAHLRACADVWGSCLATILTQDRPTIRAINPRTWLKKTDYPQQDFHASLHAFTTQRTRLLALLEPLTPAAWSRGAIVTGAGKQLERSVFSYAQWMAAHERPHLKQIARIINMMQK